jgi:hypothetical protein
VTAAAGFVEVRGTDPFSGRTYAAYLDPKGDPNAYLGAKLVREVEQLATQYATLPPDQPDARDLRAEIPYRVETLEILRSLYLTYQYIFTG